MRQGTEYYVLHEITGQLVALRRRHDPTAIRGSPRFNALLRQLDLSGRPVPRRR